MLAWTCFRLETVSSTSALCADTSNNKTRLPGTRFRASLRRCCPAEGTYSCRILQFGAGNSDVYPTCQEPENLGKLTVGVQVRRDGVLLVLCWLRCFSSGKRAVTKASKFPATRRLSWHVCGKLRRHGTPAKGHAPLLSFVVSYYSKAPCPAPLPVGEQRGQKRKVSAAPGPVTRAITFVNSLYDGRSVLRALRSRVMRPSFCQWSWSRVRSVSVSHIFVSA